ncbi:MAG: DUF5655 domain-containing protein [Spirochaetota bacterium]
MALSAREMGEAIIRNMKEKTGRSLEEWLAAIPREIVGDKKKVVTWLKTEHGVGHFQAVTIFECSEGTSEYDDRAAIEAKLFGTPGDALATAYRAVEREIMALGGDVESIVCRTYVPFRRRRQFALLAPHRGALRLGLALGGEPFEPPFGPAKGLGGSDRITHAAELDPQSEGAGLTDAVRRALRRAYEANG